MSKITSDRHFLPKFDQTLKDGRYTILRKLGEGVTASTWLVRDSIPEKYVAAKILTLEASREPGPVRERDFLRAISERAETSDAEGFDHLPALYDNFTIAVDGDVHGHLCLLQTLYSTSVSALRRSAPTKSLPVYMVRSIIYMTLQALKSLHSLRIVHTDVKLDNVLFSNARFSVDKDLDDYLAAQPAEMDSETGVAKAQPLPHSWGHDTNAHEAEKMTIALIDYGHGEWADKEPEAEGFCALALRPPEILLSSGFGTAVDIWAVGCLTFELMVGRWLFNPEDGGEDWSLEEDHLAKMMELTGQTRFPQPVLDRARLSEKYFDNKGNLLHIPELIPVPIEQAMSNYAIPGLTEEDINEGADFIRACLHLDHTQRKSAEELLKHPFAMKAFSC
ncbi:kinase-like protein [Cylindrobasidium torrendii FP15055 ss-10]|uniref:non-specific serine/threonine protein kinase n=1 Tax=Cylindrobasidium torrendii FP15055 ss-10 TaxID=1314674 RepID=A0A0D7BGL7_9AGAR|nr:kinase-like protein [Cylindrobasidium torrendii FP15055 ss-10]